MTVKYQFKTDIVERYKNGESCREIANNEDCSYITVFRELHRKEIDTSRHFWTKAEKEKLKKLYPVNSNEELLKEFPNRTKEAMMAMASILGLRKKESVRICKSCGEEFTIKHWSNRKHKALCPECVKRKWEQEHPESHRKRQRKWIRENPEKYRKYKREYLKQRREEDPGFRLDRNISTLIYQSLKGEKGGWKWEILVGYTLKDLMEHLEKQFNDEMNWDNYGSYWHVDHIKPRSLFDYTSPDDPEFKECWALENLQPLEAEENLKKSDSFPW